ncbi:MAG: GNAT family N-acetyltransferase [Cyanobacteria bacterium HKST-UBA02]|nr:GNAT family N-acetyltransferase [Cyanobacteria bacterium HKST-UBA02]
MTIPPLEYSKQIRALYVDPSCQRRGTGSLLLSEGLRILAASGAPNVMLWCIADNLAACSFYRRHGGRRIEGVMPPPDYRDMAHVIYAWPDLEAYTKSL